MARGGAVDLYIWMYIISYLLHLLGSPSDTPIGSVSGNFVPINVASHAVAFI